MKNVEHIYNSGLIAEPCKDACLFNIFVSKQIKQIISCVQCLHAVADVIVSDCTGTGEKLFDCDQPVQKHVSSNISNSEAALSNGFANEILSIVQTTARLQHKGTDKIGEVVFTFRITGFVFLDYSYTTEANVFLCLKNIAALTI